MDCCYTGKEIPSKMLAWRMYGAEMENFGDNDQPCEIPVPEIKDDELLVRIDAIGLCFSDVKLIRAGEEHPRVISKNLKEDPVIPGHEAVMTIVKTGSKIDSQFQVGQRFIIQADIYVNGKGFAYGYAINGGMAQYSVIDQRVLNGDEGSYLLPLDEKTPVAVAALMEPWTCVQAAYMIEYRKAPKKGGKVLVATEPGNKKIYRAGALLKDAAPASVKALNLDPAAVTALSTELGMTVETISEIPSDEQFDDIFICDVHNREFGEKVGKLGERSAMISFIGEFKNENWSFDVGSIHYENWYYQGAKGDLLSSGYGRNQRSKLKSGGSCWLAGGAGAMGQMHTQMAVEDPNGPKRIVVSDMDDARIENVKRLLSDKIKERGIEFKTLNPGKMTPAEFEKALKDFAPEGFDDIIMLVPVVPVLNQSATLLKEDGLMNIFAGIPAGKEGALNVSDIAAKGQRYIGSSGSTTAHLRHTLALVESGKLEPVTALAAVGGMRSLKTGLEAVINAKFPGKVVIFPNCEHMPLTPVQNLAELAKGIGDTLDNNGFYTAATEEKLLEKYCLNR